MYRHIKALGQGAFGIVYKAENIYKDYDYVAIKEYKKTRCDIHYQILREINVINLLKHPNIIEIREISGDKDIKLIMEYGGESLRSYYKKLSSEQRNEQLKFICHELITGCLYMHKLDVIHRDIKPDNILCKNDETLELRYCDFGLAKKIISNTTDHSKQAGTLNYKAPELFTTENQSYNSAIDVWALGCVLYEFVLGRKLFEGSNDLVVLKNILTKVPTTQHDLNVLNLNEWKLESCNNARFYKLPALYNISHADDVIAELEEFKNLIQQMLVLDPNKRITLDRAIQHPYFKNLQHAEIPNAVVHNFYVRKYLPENLVQKRNTYVASIINWSTIYTLNEQTICIAVNIFDEFIHEYNGRGDVDYEIISICCLILASKYIDAKPLSMKNFDMYSVDQLILAEFVVAKTINYDLNKLTLINLCDYQAKNWSQIKQIMLDYTKLLGKDAAAMREYLTEFLNVPQTGTCVYLTKV